MMGLVAAERRDTLKVSNSDTLLSIFIPTTPNPTSGFLVLTPDSEVIETNYTVEEAFKFIVSSGIVGKQLGTSDGATVPVPSDDPAPAERRPQTSEQPTPPPLRVTQQT